MKSTKLSWFGERPRQLALLTIPLHNSNSLKEHWVTLQPLGGSVVGYIQISEIDGIVRALEEVKLLAKVHQIQPQESQE